MKKSALIIALILVISIMASSFSFAFASVEPGTLLTDSASVSWWTSYIPSVKSVLYSDSDAITAYWSYTNQLMNMRGYGALDSYNKLSSICSWYNHPEVDSLVDAIKWLGIVIADAFWGHYDQYAVLFDSSFGVYRIYDQRNGCWLVNQMGHFPYYEPPKDEDGNVPAGDTTGVQWLPYEDAFQTQTNRHFVSRDVLRDMSEYYDGVILTYDKYYVITTTNPISGGYLYLCDPHGYPYVNVIDPDSTAIDTPNDYYTDEDQTTTNNGQLVDIDNGVVWFPDGTMYYIDDLIYDERTQTYYVDSHDQYVYDSFNNSFNTTNYQYEYNFYITYTSITYIGQTEEYEDPYQFYYELPDGRSSADLTAEELEQLSLTFVDVINYARSADDINMRVLYHFDGNLDDASYWSYCTQFNWVSGASITYMDEGSFEGSLYLDEKDHAFDIVLPSADLSADFTIQFRYYQSYTADPQMDSYIALGSTAVLNSDGGSFYDGSGSKLTAIPTGSWNEVALVREGDYLHYYLNGLCLARMYLAGSYGDVIRFVFGTGQQTYKKLDELRVTKGALFSGGEAYTPSAVPYDTNLTLILPDGEVPIADEYWTITPAENNLLSLDFSDPTSLVVKDFDVQSILEAKYSSESSASSFIKDFFSCGSLYTISGTTTVAPVENGISVVSNAGEIKLNNFSYVYSTSSYEYGYQMNNIPCNGLGLCVTLDGYEFHESTNLPFNLMVPSNDRSFVGKTFCLSVVDLEGNCSYVAFKVASVSSSGCTLGFVSADFTTFDIFSTMGTPTTLSQSQWDYYRERLSTGDLTFYYSFPLPFMFYFVPRSGSSSIAYMELIEGDRPGYEFTWHSAVYSSGELQESPVLAVKSNTPVVDYQIGGVRPSYPTKGQVWALVENSRISSLQQYSGYAWLAVDGRIWTGTRWIPTSSFDVFTLQDYWDMQGTTPKDEYTYIYSESGFWDWWQKQWLSFTGTLFDKMDDSGGGSGGDSLPDLEDDPLINEEDKQKFDQTEYTGIVKLLRQSYGFVSEFFTGFTMGGIQSFLKDLSDSASPIYGLFWMNGL